ncbi:MAG: LamG-like jellyroll fold domain-containing protein [Methanocorpusculum sp.]|uniref:LamG-like jellyroll fold domain-containing protein n=1 Tax=Methanocorpusculum sp. TaxID=2058474 RepID=UPI002B20F4E9|nr:LamG-like jellyroll fold domain-containing protein [Methanocorpusculum sp.]MEA5086725.1 LamG-like jellyroll fold domain-containing protein [Methanocorpusculum sp.]
MKNELGVSSVVGVVLLLLLVVLAASVIGLTLSAATQNAVESTPNVQFIPSVDPQMLYHGGGDVLYKDRLKLYANGVDITRDVSIDSVTTWTEWRTGQAIELPDDYYVANLAIIAVDTLGRDQLLYRGSGVVVTPVPTPTHLPDASFTLTSVDVGQEVSPLLLPASLARTADHFVVMGWEWFDGYWVDGHWEGWHWVPGYWVDGHWEKYAYVEFTADETDGVTYTWSSTGPDSNVDDPTSNPGYIRFNAVGDYSITLQVTNTTSGLSNSSTQTVSVRTPGITVMTWILRDGNQGSRYFHAYNSSGGWFPEYKWQLLVDRDGNTYDLEFNIGPYQDHVTSSQTISLNRWYHVSGTFEQTEGYNYLNLYVNGQNKDSDTTSDSPADYNGGTTTITKSNFNYDSNLFYEIPFAMTATEIDDVYDAELPAHS